MITTAQGVVDGMLPVQAVVSKASIGFDALGNLGYDAGLPAAAANPSPGVAGEALTSWDGQVPFPATVAGQKVYLAKVQFAGKRIAGVRLLDRLWHNSGLTSAVNTAQTVDSVAWPARDLDESTNGRGVGIALEHISGTAVNSSTWAISYTNSAGTSGRTGTTGPQGNGQSQGDLVPFSLQAGDVGVRSVQSATYTGATGVVAISLVAYRKIVTVAPAEVEAVGTDYCALTCKSAVEMALPRLFDNSVPMLCAFAVSITGGAIFATIEYARG